MSVRRIILWSLRSSTSARGLKSGISAAMLTGQPAVSHCLIGPIADRPSHTAPSMASGVMPEAQIAPVPVMRTLRWVTVCLAPALAADRARAIDFFGVAQDDAAVGAAETERVGKRHTQPPPLRLADDEVEIAL